MQLAHSSRLLADVPCTRLDQGTSFPPPSGRTCSVPIIPSVQATDSIRDQGSSALITENPDSFNHARVNPESEEASLLDPSPVMLPPSRCVLREELRSLVTYPGPRYDSHVSVTAPETLPSYSLTGTSDAADVLPTRKQTDSHVSPVSCIRS